MTLYYVNNQAQDTGEHEVHTADCLFFPDDNRYLGEFPNCHPAVEKAQEIYSQADGCKFCCEDCHSG